MSKDEENSQVALNRAAIYQVVNSIPAGKVCSYGQVAELAGLARAARLVGSVLKNLPKDSKLPWHRVINAQGMISLSESSPGYRLQRRRLEDEGVAFRGSRVNLKHFGWLADR